MRLSAIRLHGFKSFAEPTVFPVDAAVTGIIGPNGCGKSNIIDAVRWVLGESAAKQLRGSALTDVIFAGSSTRKAAAMASVELHFDNSDGSAAGAFARYAEIVVRRSVASDGSSQYAINRERCRRRDIVELLQGTGVGARSYAVIEQGMVSRMVESKPEELRAFVEEAAGVALYRSRRRDSEKRMEEVRELLDRHHDRLQQLGKSRERLEKEAATATVHRRLASELAGHEYRLQSWQWQQAHHEHAALEGQYQQEERILAESMIGVQRSQQALDALRAQVRETEAAFAPLDAACQHAQAALSRQSAEQASVQTRLDYAARALRQAQERHDKLRQQQQQDDGEAEAHQHALQLLDSSMAQWRAQEQTARAEYETAAEGARAARLALEQAQALREQHQQQRASHEARLQALIAQHSLLESRLAESVVTESVLPDREALLMDVEERALALENLADALADAQETLQTQEAAAQAARENEQAAQQALASWQSKADMLAEWHAGQRPTDAPPHWQTLAQLADSLQVADDWQEAVERYLDSALHALCAELSPSEASAHQQAFVLAGEVPAAWCDIVQCPYGLTAWFAGLEPLALHDDAVQLAALTAGKRYLTLSGSVVSRDGFQPARSEQRGTLARLGQWQEARQRVQESEAALHRATQSHAQAHSAWQAARQSWQTLQQQHGELTRAQQQAQHELALAAQQHAHQQALAAQQARNREALHADLAANLAEQEEQRRALNAQQEHALADSAALQQSWQQAESARARSEAQWQEMRQQVAQGEQEILRHRSWLEARQGGQSRLQEALAEVEEMVAQETQVLEEQHWRFEENALQIESLQEAVAQHEAARQAAFATLHNEREALDSAQSQHHAHLQTQALAEERRNHLHQQLETLAQQRAELDRAFAESERQPLRFAAHEQVDVRRLQEEIRRLRQEMARLGAVNMAAVEAFAEVDDEFQTLFQQCADLQESLRLLLEAIAELDAQTRERLQATFTTVNQHFGEYFPLLFRGGEAHLAWTEGDILDAGIRIHVRPPGKNVKQLSVLSGGEKALTAVALVFSFFRLNPAPFCLLDEVDAPLDDANVARLNALLREMARDTQFVMITHHKRSMQSCDHLIGVTMSEPGVSRLVAVKFEHENISQ